VGLLLNLHRRRVIHSHCLLVNEMILLLSPRKNASTVAIETAAEAEGWTVCRLTNWRVPDKFLNLDEKIVAYGEPLFVAAMADSLQLALIEPQFDWLSSLPFEYTYRKIFLTSLKEARKYPSTVFAKPADDKCFAARVYENGLAIEASQLLPEETPVLLSEEVTWVVEHRYFIRERKVAATSPYLHNGEIIDDSFIESQSDAAERNNFVQKLLNDFQIDLPPAVVIDVGYIAGSGWSVIEANPVFGAGIYRCDPNLVLAVLERSMVSQHQISDSDKRWIIVRQLV